MDWLVFSYSLPAKGRSSPRVTLWRRLGRLGAIAPAGSLYVLPAREECAEALQWLAQEIRQAKGEAVVMHVERFEGLTDEQLIGLFNAARAEEYGELEAQAAQIEKKLGARLKPEARDEAQDALDKLRRRYNDIARVDYFDCPQGMSVSAHLTQIAQALSPAPVLPQVAPTMLAEYQDKRWVTRPHPHVDRLSTIWLMRRFINPNALVRYSLQPEPDEIAFDMNNAQFGHQGNFCTFETMLQAFGLAEPALQALAEIVHEIDLRDGQYAHPATSGVDAILAGWLRAGYSDAELEAHGVALFEGLYLALTEVTPRAPRKRKR